MTEGRSGKALVLPIAAVLVAALAITLAYKVTQPSRDHMSFERLPAGGNQTAFSLDFKATHAALFLEDHLKTVAQTGVSDETVKLRVDSMRETLQKLTGSAGPSWVVLWEGTTIQITG